MGEALVKVLNFHFPKFGLQGHGSWFPIFPKKYVCTSKQNHKNIGIYITKLNFVFGISRVKYKANRIPSQVL
jgi:hypothetical protein